MKTTSTRPRLGVTVGDTDIVNHAGTRLVADVADDTGLTAGLSAAMASTKQRRRGHDRGRVLVDLAVLLVDGGDTISDLAVLRNQPSLFGPVASNSTAWRTLDAVGPGPGRRNQPGPRRRQSRGVGGRAADPGFYVS